MILYLTLIILLGELKVDGVPFFFKGLQDVWGGSQVLIYKKGQSHVERRSDSYDLPDCFGFVLRLREEYEHMILD